MWEFRQYDGRDGDILHDGLLVGHAYSGWDDGDNVREPGEGKNDPSKQAVRNIGPIPIGKYRIGRPFFHETAGPYTMRLTPLEGTDTHGRNGFLIHGDSARRPGTVSRGCIVASRPIRMIIGETVEAGDDILDVTVGDEAPGIV